MALLYRNDKLLLLAMALGAAVFWVSLALLLFTLSTQQFPGLSLVYPATLAAVLAILAYAVRYFRCAGQVASLYGHAALIGARQYPELHARLVAACKRLKLETVPTAFVWRQRHDHYYFSVRFARRKYLALHSKLLDALGEHAGALDFFIGYELGRLYDRPTRWAPLLFPATLLPLIGPAYARARIYAYNGSVALTHASPIQLN